MFEKVKQPLERKVKQILVNYAGRAVLVTATKDGNKYRVDPDKVRAGMAAPSK